MRIDIIMGRIFLALLSCAAIFILLEVASRYLLPDSTLADRKGLNESTDAYRQPKPYVMFGGAANASFSKNERLNEHGYRGKAPSREKHKGELRVFILGGSTVVFGEPPLPVLIEELFRKDGHSNISVYNYGVLSSVSGMELSRIIFEIADFKPDLIVMYSGGNDLGSPPFYDPRPGYPFNFMVYDSNPILESNLKNYPTLLMTLYGSNLLRRLFPTFFMNHLVPLEKLRRDALWGTREWEDRMVVCYVNNVTKAAMVSEAFGTQFMAFFQPLIYYKKNLTVEEINWSGTEVDDYYYMRAKVQSGIDAFRQKEKLNFADVSNIFADTKETVFTDRIHLTQKANSVVAAELYRHIAPLVINRGGVP